MATQHTTFHGTGRMQYGRQRLILTAALVIGAAAARPALAIGGSSLALKSTGSGAGNWTLARDGYVGTYINLATPGSVTINVSASGTASGGVDPHMNIVIADAKAGFDVASGFNNYVHTLDLPAGTYLVRTEFNNDLEQSGRALTIGDLSVTGATVLNTSSSSNALAAADTYVQNFRRGNVTIGLLGVAPGTMVDVSLKRHAFNFGTAVPGVSYTSVNNYLGSGGTARQTNYQQRLNRHFNAVVPENAGKWGSNEDVRDENPNAPTNGMANVDLILNYAQSHGMQARMHNLLWGDNSFNGQQPSWVLNNDATSGLLDQAYLGTNPNAAADLRGEISERIDHYVGTGAPTDRAHKYVELDVYNESFHTGSDPNLAEALRHNYWNVYDAAGIADIYREAKEAVAASGAQAKVFVNEYGVLGSGDYGGWYFDHIEQIRQAGVAAGYGDVVQGIGVQHYPGGSQNSGNIMRTLQNLAVQGMPIALTEFGVSSGVSASTAATILEDSMRLVFGTAEATGFFMWGFHQESGTGATTLFAPAAALYTVNTSNFNDWTLTAAGARHEWLFGLGEDPTKGGANLAPWDTELTDLVVGEDGTIEFDGFWGDYELTVDGTTYSLELVKGTQSYQLVVALAADFNDDNVVDDEDLAMWQASYEVDAGGDADEDGDTDGADLLAWQQQLGLVRSTALPDSIANATPEPSTALLALAGAAALRRRRFAA
jgi:GH35 family endo-1,4-beta-xylanase